MKRVNAFLTILIVSIAALIVTTIIGFSIFTTTNQNNNWMSQMWGNNGNGHDGMGSMMGQNATQSTTASSILPYFGVLFAVLIAVLVISIIGVGYYLLYPQIRMGATAAPVTITNPVGNPSQTVSAYESVTKTLTEEELKVIQVLNSHNGKYLQKYIKNETGLSRLQTHRIIARLAERGIVTLEKTGNTNQVYLADWLNQKI